MAWQADDKLVLQSIDLPLDLREEARAAVGVAGGLLHLVLDFPQGVGRVSAPGIEQLHPLGGLADAPGNEVLQRLKAALRPFVLGEGLRFLGVDRQLG